ncbi:hypothetical protein M404DRAFT_854611 [Pisolithus tinctorius Marx 270]|uniref:Uncharacterized protein n=1 Tax=Pisolithus tinctorius Marx 270 TaxID=870435 RepID=A0A0C3NS01_PISTI|nr:hypothetical protein M404DRAFT_854611 [Pisolithus tinctorius Marx 270]
MRLLAAVEYPIRYQGSSCCDCAEVLVIRQTVCYDAAETEVSENVCGYKTTNQCSRKPRSASRRPECRASSLSPEGFRVEFLLCDRQ